MGGTTPIRHPLQTRPSANETRRRGPCSLYKSWIGRSRREGEGGAVGKLSSRLCNLRQRDRGRLHPSRQAPEWAAALLLHLVTEVYRQRDLPLRRTTAAWSA